MRHHLTSTWNRPAYAIGRRKAVDSLAFAVKLLCIGFVYLISISFCAAQETGQESVTELIALLDAQDELIIERAAEALMKHGDSSATPALMKAMKRVQDDYIQWIIAGALWYLAPNDQSAEAILNVARKYEGQDKYTLFSIVDDPIGRGHMTEAERLNFLLNYKLAMRVGVPEALDIRLIPQKVYEQLLFDNDDRLFLEKHRSQAVDIMLVQLRDRGSPVAALLLGYFKEPKALPDLKKWFIESDHSYGWEGAWNRLDYYNFPEHHCYEEAIKHITGKTLNEVIKLTDEQVTQLVEGYRQNADEPTLYVLFRLKPDIARQEAARKFRRLREETTKETWEIKLDRFLLCVSIQDLLPKGLLLTEVRELLGKPDKVRESSWFYDCGTSPIDNPYVLTITFDNGRLSQVSSQRF